MELKKNANCGVRTHEYLCTVDLKSTPLDHSGKLAFYFLLYVLIFDKFKIFFYKYCCKEILLILCMGLEPTTLGLEVLRAIQLRQQSC